MAQLDQRPEIWHLSQVTSQNVFLKGLPSTEIVYIFAIMHERSIKLLRLKPTKLRKTFFIRLPVHS